VEIREKISFRLFITESVYAHWIVCILSKKQSIAHHDRDQGIEVDPFFAFDVGKGRSEELRVY